MTTFPRMHFPIQFWVSMNQKYFFFFFFLQKLYNKHIPLCSGGQCKEQDALSAHSHCYYLVFFRKQPNFQVHQQPLDLWSQSFRCRARYMFISTVKSTGFSYSKVEAWRWWETKVDSILSLLVLASPHFIGSSWQSAQWDSESSSRHRNKRLARLCNLLHNRIRWYSYNKSFCTSLFKSLLIQIHKWINE